MSTENSSCSTLLMQGNSVTTVWPFTFYIKQKADITLYLHTYATGAYAVVSSSEFSATGFEDPNGGSVTYPLAGSPLTSSFGLVIHRNSPYDQETEFPTQRGFDPHILETALDEIVYQTQQNRRDINRAWQVPPGQTAGFLPRPTIGNTIVMGSDGNFVDGGPIGAGGAELTNIYPFRTTFVTAVDDGLSLPINSVVLAEGYFYKSSPGSTVIPDLPNFLPMGPVFVKHFGAVGGAVFQDKTGPDDSTAFESALNYCAAIKTRLWIDDYHNLLSEPFTSQGIILDGHEFCGTGKFNSGVRIKLGAVYPTGTYSQVASTTINISMVAHGKVDGDLVYIDFTSGSATDDWFIVAAATADTFQVTAAASGTNSGNCRIIDFPEHARGINFNGQGSFIRDMEVMVHQFSQRPPDRGDWGANIGAGYFFGPNAANLVSNCGADNVLLTRSPSDIGDESYMGVGIIAVGNVEGYAWTNISYDVTSGVGFNYGLSQHWGCSADDPLNDPDTTYHPHDGLITFDGPLKGCAIGVGLSSSYNVKVGPFDMEGGGKAVYILPGDNADAYATARDVGRVLKGLRFGFVTGMLTATASGDHGIEIFTQSQSKFETEGGAVKTRALEIDLIMEGADLTHEGVCPANTDAINLFTYIGSIELGRIKSSGYSRRHLMASGAGASLLSYDSIGSDQGIYLATGVTVDGRNNTVSPSYSDTDSGGVTVLGVEVSSTLASDSNAGATTSTLSVALDEAVLPGDVLVIGTDEVMATGSSHYSSTVIHHSALLVTALAGATVTLRKKCKGRLNGNVLGGRYGMRFQNCEMLVWGEGPLNTGQHGYRIESGANVNLVGAWPHATGQNGATSTNYDIEVLANGHITILGADMGPGDAQLEAHIHVAAGGSCHVESAVYRGARPIISSGTAFGDFSFSRVVDATGVVVEKPGASGSDSNGNWTYDENGLLHQWLRNVATDASGDLTWTFPKSFLAASSVDVKVTPASVANPFFGQGLNTTVTSAAIKTFNAAGAGATAAVNLAATGRWR